MELTFILNNKSKRTFEGVEFCSFNIYNICVSVCTGYSLCDMFLLYNAWTLMMAYGSKRVYFEWIVCVQQTAGDTRTYIQKPQNERKKK
jgi:hypothetical protein